MKCVDCELHDYIVGTHFCNYKGKSGRRRPRRISEEDAHKDVPCEFVEEMKEQTMSRYGIMIHRKGTSYEDDFWFTDNKRFQIRSFSHDAAEAVLKIVKYQYGDKYSFKIRRLD